MTSVGILGMAVIGSADRAAASPRRGEVLRCREFPGRVWIPPVYDTVTRTVEVPAVYEQRPREAWRGPVYEERRVLAEVPARVLIRRVPRLDWFGAIIGFEIVEEVVEPARQVWRVERVLVRPGGYEIVYEPVLVRPASTTVVYDRVLVRLGYWAAPHRPMIQKAPPYVRGHGLRAAHLRPAYDPELVIRVGW